MTPRQLLFLALSFVGRTAVAQGVTTVAIQGSVSAEGGSPVAGARIRLANSENGNRWEAATRADGGFLLENVAVGSYRVDVSALGYTPQSRSGIVLALGQRLVMSFVLRRAAVELSALVVQASSDPVLGPGRTGPSQVISRTKLLELPNPGRDFTNVMLLSPQVVSTPAIPAIPTSGIAIGGQNRLYNSFQVDGGVEQDRYTGQLSGRQAFSRPVSFDAIEEIQVLAAPFDVRHGGFAGGLVNAVTRSGGNQVHGSLFGFLADPAYQDAKSTSWQLGGTVGGPIVRDRLHYFVSVDGQERVVPDPGPLISDTAGGADVARIGIDYASAARLRRILESQYHLAPGSLGPVSGHVPTQDVLGKISFQLAPSNHLEASHHLVRGKHEDFLTRTSLYYALSSFGQQDATISQATRLVWTSLVGGRWSNELLASHLRVRDDCRPRSSYPEIRVMVGPQAFLHAGTSGGCAPTNALRQDVFGVTDNATIGFHRHTVSVGAHAELLHFRDALVNGSPGLWVFGSLDSLESGLALQYQRTLRGPGANDGVNFRGLESALYAQDRWNPTLPLTLTIGLRLDVPFLLDRVATNRLLLDSLGIDTERVPTGNASWSPRLGINYDVGGTGRLFVRGGAGLFSGPPPYRWLSNVYRDDGTHELFLNCQVAQGVPQFDPVNQPTTCRSAGPNPQLSSFAPDVRWPQDLKMSLGMDGRLFEGLVASLDFLHTSSLSQLYVTDANLTPPVGVEQGENNRPLYGTFNAAMGRLMALRPYRGLNNVVVRTTNASGDRSFSLSAQVRTESDRAVQGSVLYAYSRSLDRMSLAHLPARALLQGTVLDGTLEQRRLGTSLFDVPHRVQLTGSVRLPGRANLALLYSGSSGRPFTYTVIGDANGDGMGVNFRQDPIYVPRDSLDITLDSAAQWSKLDDFIKHSPCLSRQRGRIMARNSCRNPWFGTLGMRLTKSFPTGGRHVLEVSADAYNVLNLVNSHWGLARYDAVTFAADLLDWRSYDVTHGRGIYRVADAPRNQIDYLASRSQLELGARYVF